MTSLIAGAAAALLVRYTPDALRVLDADERARFLDEAGRPRHPDQFPWELLYRIEPELYDQLVAGERLHEGILRWLPARCGRVLEIGAGTGRLTLELATRCEAVLAVEPSAALRRILEGRLRERHISNVNAVPGFFDALPMGDQPYDMVISCSAFTVDALDDPEHCLRVMESRCAPGGVIVLVWPDAVSWLRARGFEHVVFEGPMLVEFSSAEEAIALARIFYPEAVDAVVRNRSRLVDFTTLGLSPPRDLCWKRCGSP